VKEKEALEASIKALTSSKQRDVDKTEENQEAIYDPLNVNKEVSELLMD
jgi:chaperonin cofactor prefoldin